MHTPPSRRRSSRNSPNSPSSPNLRMSKRQTPTTPQTPTSPISTPVASAYFPETIEAFASLKQNPENCSWWVSFAIKITNLIIYKNHS